MTTQIIHFCKRTLLVLATTIIAGAAQAETIDELKSSLSDLVGPRGANATIVESPMPGVYQADLGDRVVFITQKDNLMLLGDVYDTTRKVSLGQEIKQQKAIGVIDKMDEADMIVFEPAQTKRTMTVYTDVDCPYCRKLHEEVPTLLESGVKVRYLWYPRSGIGTPSYDKAVSIWCAKDQTAAMDDAKLHNKIAEEKCSPNPVADQYKSGQSVGVRGTPTIVLDDGTIIGGYMPAKSLLANMGITAGTGEPLAKAKTE